MPVTVHSFAKINLGLAIGPSRPDGFHSLRTIYQSISMSDTIKVDVQRGTGLEIRCRDTRVPCDETNTCWRVAERVMKTLKKRGKVVITIDKKLPVQGGMGAASSNAVAAMFALEKALKATLEPEQRLRIAAEVGSDLPLFLIGGTVLGMGRGEEVYPLEDLPVLHLVVVTPEIGVSTPRSFADWDAMHATAAGKRSTSGLTAPDSSATIDLFSQRVFAWLTAGLPRAAAGSTAGVPTKSGGRAETPLLDLVRAGIENDFESVVFHKHPELREVKRGLERTGAQYASLSGSGSTVYGLFASAELAKAAAQKLVEGGITAYPASTLTRPQYWRGMFGM